METKNELIALESPKQIEKFAIKLKDLIVKNNLYVNVKGKNYVTVDGWQIAGAYLGIYPNIENIKDLSSENTIKYRASVTLRDTSDRVVGTGFAICTNKESGKTSFDEYAVASMAQTRAIGKAFRSRLGWLVKLAGYESTPADEITIASNNREDKVAEKIEKWGKIEVMKR